MEEKINLEDLSSKYPRVKFGCAKKLLQMSADNPSLLYSEFDFFVELLESENNIIKWTAIDVIGNLSRVDKNNKLDKLMSKLFNLLNSGELITANHAISALSDIALAKPEYRNKIVDELLKVEHYNYDTDECRNIALGKVVLALERHFNKLTDKEKVIEFLKKQTKNTRAATSRKAEKFLKKIAKNLP